MKSWETCDIYSQILLPVRKENVSSQSAANSPVEKEREEPVFQVSYPSAFSKLIASRQVSPLLTSQSWSPR